MMRPYFYDKFVCIGDKCTDNCCIGWEIDIDPPAMERFSKVPGEFGERLRAAVHGGEQPTFALTSGDRCALLREDGLCELILRCGDGILCDICALHPRFFNEFGAVREAGLGLCCEEVCRLMFSSSEPLEFILDAEDTAALSEDDDYTALLRESRATLFAALQERSFPITQRLSRCAEYAWRIQEAIELDQPLPSAPEDYPDIFTAGEIARLLDTLSGMESVNADWTATLERLVQRQEELLAALPEFLGSTGEEWRYEHIAAYFLYRHFTDCLSDGAIYARAMMACGSAAAVMLMDCMRWLDSGALSGWDRILDLKLYSKQVEYSEENTGQFIAEYD